jgi:hypothetical protein
MRDLLDTAKTAVLLNGIPGRWINCRNGLRQGDPLSPYLFIIVADILRRLLQHPTTANCIRHPLLPNAPCPVLQYADDTLIFLSCSTDAVTATKHILEIFEHATDLSINYHKTTFLTIGVPSDAALELASTFGTTVLLFPKRILASPFPLTKSLSPIVFL